MKETITINENSKKNIFTEYYDSLNKSNSRIEKMHKLGNFLKGNGLSKSDISTSGQKCILYGELYTKYKETVNCVYSRTKAEIKNPMMSKIGDVLIPCSGETDVDISTATCLLEKDIIIGGDINVFRKNSEFIDSRYLSYVINYAKKYEIARLAQGFSIVHLYGENLKNLEVKIPTKIEQNKLINLLEKFNSKNEILKTKVEFYEKLKQALMQQLLTGKVRVKI